MLHPILSHTPLWVWAILTGLLWLGLVQTMPRRARLRRVILLPLAMTGLSLYGTLSSFGHMPTSWIMWAGAACMTLLWVASSAFPAGIQYDAARQVFSLPGSWVPLGLMMAIFLTKYTVGVMLAMQPALAHDTAVAAIAASLHGALSGIFLGRMARLLRLSQASAARPAATASVAWG